STLAPPRLRKVIAKIIQAAPAVFSTFQNRSSRCFMPEKAPKKSLTKKAAAEPARLAETTKKAEK
ncbi:hypothetical protein, partial [uncultured Rhodoblastus sp.]|uniref:hypothetical protein n=1 Tax=uncultured Rhodoblastus sp. TaxID=543037 RepID=UPI0025E056CF